MDKQTYLSTLLKMTLFVALLILLAACSGAENSSSEAASPSATNTPQPSATLTLTPTITSTHTIAPSPLPTSRPTSTPGLAWKSYYPLVEPNEIITADSTIESLQDLIIFNGSWTWGPFANITLAEYAYGKAGMFAFSPDGQRAGALSPSNYPAPIYLPTDPSKKPILVEYGVSINDSAIWGIELPPECYPSADEDERFEPCDNFMLSPDEKYLGFFFGFPSCGRGMIVLDAKTSELVFQLPQANGHHFRLLRNGKALISTGGCNSGPMFFMDLISGTQKELGPSGTFYWNVDQTAFAVDANEFTEGNRIWAFNLETNQLFIPPPENTQIDDHPVWTPSKRYLLYQHRTLSRVPLEFDQARRIMLVDAQTGYQQVLLSDSAYDFHLGPDSNRAVWYGDWIQIRRIEFTPSPYNNDSRACYFYGSGCSSPVENFALNWKTGELVPWEEFIQTGLVITPESTEIPHPDRTEDLVYKFPKGSLYLGPNENTLWLGAIDSDGYVLTAPDLDATPIYSHPGGLYAYFVGIDGRTLWMVPQEGDPVLWVINGENYIYLPPVSEGE